MKNQKGKKIQKLFSNRLNLVYLIAGFIGFCIFIFYTINALDFSSEKYLVQNGEVELTELTTALVVKDEKTIEQNTEKSLVPVIAEGAKVAKGSIIATYKGKDFDNYEQKLQSMDEEILNLMKELPTVYSSDVDAIEDQIYNLVKSSTGENSYIKMQDYEQTINKYINKRAKIIGELSPEGAEIKNLIKARNEYEESGKASNDNVIASVPGTVSYKTDGLEDKINTNNINNLTYSSVKAITSGNKSTMNSGIKIVNNYQAYVIVNVNSKNLDYITLDKTYKLRLVEDSNFEFSASLVRFKENEKNIEVVFKIQNNIEKLINIRETDFEIVWWTDSGLYVPRAAIKNDSNGEVSYVKVVKYGEYVDVPVKILRQNDKYAIVNNYTDAQLKSLNISKMNTLKVYDTLLVKINEK